MTAAVYLLGATQSSLPFLYAVVIVGYSAWPEPYVGRTVLVGSLFSLVLVIYLEQSGLIATAPALVGPDRDGYLGRSVEPPYFIAVPLSFLGCHSQAAAGRASSTPRCGVQHRGPHR